MTPLHSIGDAVRELLLHVPPAFVRALFLALPAIVLVWVLRLPARETRFQSRDGRMGADLKWGAALALGLQLLIYAVL